jgi:hypothetical protein
MNGIEIHTLRVQYISHKWINYSMIFQPHEVQYISHKWMIFQPHEVQNISHKWLNQGMNFPPLVMIFTLLYDEIQF